MFRLSFISCLCCILLLTFSCFSQKLNKLNKHGLRTGKWIIYADSAKTKKLFEGKFKNDKTVGTCSYYRTDGILERKEKNLWFKRIKTTLYHSNGKIMLKGKAKIENLPDMVHYYFYGKWNGFDTSGVPEKFVYYKKGEKVKTVYIDKNNRTNDSLTEALNRLENIFTENNKALIDTIRMYSMYVIRCEKIQKRLYEKDSSAFCQVASILKNYGYPAKEVVHEAIDIPFFILSLAPAAIKERHLETLKNAADKGSIQWSSLAYYIDKIRVAKGQEQIYGTQFFYNEKKEIVYYPILNPENLSTRRKSVGLVD